MKTTASPTAKTDGLEQRMARHGVLQFGDKGKAGIGAEIGVDQLDGDGAQLIAFLGFRSRKAAPGVAADFGHGELDRIPPVAVFVLGAQILDGLLHGPHDFHRIVACRAGCHGEVAGDRAALRRIEEAPLNIARDEQSGLGRQGHKG